MQESTQEQRDRATREFLKYQNFVRMIAWETTPIDSLIDDMVNDTFIIFVQKASQWDYVNVKAILRVVTRHVAMKYWKEKKNKMTGSIREVAELLEKERSNGNLPWPDEEGEDVIALNMCIEKLTPRCQELLKKYYFEQVPLTQYAQEKEMCLGTVQNLLFRIREVLRKCISSLLKKDDLDV